MPSVRAGEPPLEIGISSNVLEFGNAPGRLDGIGIYTREIEAALLRQGIGVTRVGAPMRSGSGFVRARQAALSYPLPMAYTTAASSALRLPLAFGGAVERRIDVYHATDYLVPRLAHTPTVATLYDAIPLTNPEWANPRLRTVKNWLLRNCAQTADAVIAISNAAVADLVRHYQIPRERIRVITLGVDEQWFERPSAASIGAALRAHGLSRGYFLHVGTLQPRKNLDALVTAYERLPAGVRAHRQLVLVGKYGWRVEALRERLLSKRTEGRVVWLDYVSRDVLQALYYGAGAFVFPSLAEGFGLPVIEALAVGLPVIANDLPALVEIAGKHATFVDAASVEALESALSAFREDADDTADMRRAHARTHSWDRCAAATIDLYRSLL